MAKHFANARSLCSYRSTLKTIGNEWSNNPDDCYREGLLEWLKGGEGSWRDIVNALSSPTVGHSDVAMTVEKDHIQSTTPIDVKSCRG